MVYIKLIYIIDLINYEAVNYNVELILSIVNKVIVVIINVTIV